MKITEIIIMDRMRMNIGLIIVIIIIIITKIIIIKYKRIESILPPIETMIV